MTLQKIKELLRVVLTNRPQSRESLCRRIGCSDRRLRLAVQELRAAGIPICSNAQTSGYWIGSEEEIRHLARDFRSRGLSLLEVSRKLELGIGKDEQVRWRDVLEPDQRC
jgi:biotin operon repressor